MTGGDSVGTAVSNMVELGKTGDLADGRVVRWTDWTGLKLSLVRMMRSPRPLKTYLVKLEGDRIMAEM